MSAQREIIELNPAPLPTSVAALTPMDMLNTALTQGAHIEVLEKLMGLQERWEANQARKAFDAAISEAKKQIRPITRNATAHNNKRYADFAAIASAVDPVLAAHGLSYRFRTNQNDRIHVTCILSHKDGHSEETTLSGPADTSGSKNAIQAIGSTVSYLMRYSLVQMLGLSTTEDDDGRAAGMGGSSETLTPEQVEKLREALKFRGGHEDRFLKFIKVSSLEDIRADKFEECLSIINGGRK